MTYGEVPGLDKPVSRLVMGVDNQPTLPHAATIFDDFVERGGTTFDTAYIYGGGRGEKLLGQWMTSRGNRDEVVVIGKGAHTPHCDPASITSQLDEIAGAAADRSRRPLPDAPRQRGDPGRGIRRRDGLALPGRADSGAYGGSNWSTATVRRGERVCRDAWQAAVDAAEQPPEPGPGVRRTVGGLPACQRRRVAGVAAGAAGGVVPVVESGPRVLHRPGQAGGPLRRGAGPLLLLGRELRAVGTGRGSWRRSTASSRRRSRWPGCCTSRTRCSR